MAYACRGCQLEQEMKRIPATFIPISVRTDLSKVLDPPRDLKDNDYRYFAERNGLMPRDVEWLDSQKSQWKTSSIGMVLDYLIDKHRERFTVYHVYKTLCEMKSDGQRIICEGMPEIRRLYHWGTRPGEEHTDTQSADSPRQVPPAVQRQNGNPSVPVERSHSPPPPYDESPPSQQSLHMSLAGGDGMHALNNLNAGYPCGNASEVNFPGGQVSGHHLPSKQNGSRTRVKTVVSQQDNSRALSASECDHGGRSSRAQCSRTSPCEISFQSSSNPHRLMNLPPDRRKAGESSYHSEDTGDRQAFSASLPSYLESQNQMGMYLESSTRMKDLKLPLEGPEVSPGTSSGLWLELNAQPDSSPDSHLYPNGPVPSPPVLPHSRPTSFPQAQVVTGKKQLSAKRPASDARYCSHSGACSCWTEQQSTSTEATPSPVSEMSGPPSSSFFWDGCSDHHDGGSEGISVEGMPWNESRHQTEVKRPLCEGNSSSWRGPNSPRKALSAGEAQCPGAGQPCSAPATQGDRNLPSSARGLTSRFVFVLAADIEETERLDQQVSALCQQLQAQGISYVAVRSTCVSPVYSLPPKILQHLPDPEDFRSIKKFIRICFKKASKVLMLVTPGYLPYADDYSKDARKEETYQQKLIRQIQEDLKSEFFERKRVFRIWPVLLHEMKANRLHLPSFLSNSVYYWFPCYQGVENVLAILKEDLHFRPSSVKRSI